MGFVEYRVRALIEQTRQLQAIPQKRTQPRLVNHLSRDEIEAILNTPLLNTRSGIRDRAMIHLCFAAVLWVSELVNLPLDALTLHATSSVRILGKGRRERSLPL